MLHHPKSINNIYITTFSTMGRRRSMPTRKASMVLRRSSTSSAMCLTLSLELDRSTRQVIILSFHHAIASILQIYNTALPAMGRHRWSNSPCHLIKPYICIKTIVYYSKIQKGICSICNIIMTLPAMGRRRSSSAYQSMPPRKASMVLRRSSTSSAMARKKWSKIKLALNFISRAAAKIPDGVKVSSTKLQ